MPALDKCHPKVIRAFQKEGWYVGSSPFKLATIYRIVYIDLQMAKGANGTTRHIMLNEIKCFPDPDNTTRDTYIAVGQFLIYRAMIQEQELPYPLYLVVPENIFHAVFDVAVMKVVQESRINIVVVNMDTETITQWIEM